MQGYWNNEPATRAALAGGWLHTGDLGALGSDGALRITGRASEVINRAGVKIAPADVERALEAHPGIVETVAFGVPDGAAGQAVAAAVVLDDPSVTPEGLRRFIAGRLPASARPRVVLVVEDIPRSPTGKVLLDGLRAEVLRRLAPGP